MGRVLILFFPVLLYASMIRGQQNGDTINRVDENGKKQGYWKKYDESGMIIYEGAFKADIPVGEFRYYYPDGKTKAKSFFSDNGKKSSTTTYHYSGKVMSEGFYVDKEKDSLWKYFDVNGIFLKEEFYRNHQKWGVWRSFYQDGNVAEEMQWKEDMKDGPWVQYFYDGTKKMEASFLNDEMHGPVIHYFPSGRTRITGAYDQSYRSGTWYYMNDSSKVIKIEYYEDGQVVKEEVFDVIDEEVIDREE